LTIVRFAQGPDANASHAASVERVRAALLPQQVVADGTGIVFAPKPEDVRLGVLTFVRPDTAGGIVAIGVPIGAMIRGAAHSIAALQHRRAERAAHAEVVKALAAFQKSQQQ